MKVPIHGDQGVNGVHVFYCCAFDRFGCIVSIHFQKEVILQASQG